MSVIVNKWIEKLKPKASSQKQTAPAYERSTIDDAIPINTGKHQKRFTKTAKGYLIRTLRGIRR